MSYWASLEEEASGTPNEVCGFEIADELTAPLGFALGGDGAIPLIRNGLERLAGNSQPLGMHWDQVVQARLTLEHMRTLSADYPNCFWAVD